MCVSAFCPECRALWAWLFNVKLRCCVCPACGHRLVSAARARPRWPGRDLPVYHVGSFDVCRALWRRQAGRCGVRARLRVHAGGRGRRAAVA